MPNKLHLLPPGIAERLKELPDRVAGIAGLNALWLFGSIARDETTPISDVDLAYLPDKALQGEALEGVETDWAIDHARVYDALQVRLMALESFACHIARWLKDHTDEGRAPTGASK